MIKPDICHTLKITTPKGFEIYEHALIEFKNLVDEISKAYMYNNFEAIQGFCNQLKGIGCFHNIESLIDKASYLEIIAKYKVNANYQKTIKDLYSLNSSLICHYFINMSSHLYKKN